MEMRIEAGDCMYIPHIEAARFGYGLYLLLGNVAVLALYGFQVLKNAISVVGFGTYFDKRAAWDRHEYALEHPHLDEPRINIRICLKGRFFAGAQSLDYNKRKFLKQSFSPRAPGFVDFT